MLEYENACQSSDSLMLKTPTAAVEDEAESEVAVAATAADVVVVIGGLLKQTMLLAFADESMAVFATAVTVASWILATLPSNEKGGSTPGILVDYLCQREACCFSWNLAGTCRDY